MTWHVVISTRAYVLAVLLLPGILLCTEINYILRCNAVAKNPESNPEPPDSATCYNTPADQAPENLSFATYALPGRV
jgi:hypothetical protein